MHKPKGHKRWLTAVEKQAQTKRHERDGSAMLVRGKADFTEDELVALTEKIKRYQRTGEAAEPVVAWGQGLQDD